jgi:hypothetical protein
MTTNKTTLWGIERQHPRSTSIDSETFGRTRKDVLALHRAKYVRAWADTPSPSQGGELWDRNFAAGMFRAVRVTVSWESP